MQEIESVIRQNKFKNEYQKAFINLIYTSNFLKYKNANNLKKFGLTTEQFNVLRILRGQYPKPATMQLITERMLDKSSNASRLVEKLRIKNLVERAVSQEDRRAVNVVINKKGLDLLEQLDKEEDKWLEELKVLSIEETNTLNYLLNKIRG